MLTFESDKENDKLEIHGDKEGLLKLAKILTEMAEQNSSEHMHLMTQDWGGSELSNEKQGLDNNLYNHGNIYDRFCYRIWNEKFYIEHEQNHKNLR